MKKCNKYIAILMAVVIVISSFALSVFNAFGKTQRLILDTKMTSYIDGEDDRTTFIYTPEVSGTYSLLSYNVPASECYLSIKVVDPETKVKEYKQLAYAINDPNYEENDHNMRQFCLTYHLEAGVTYYYDVGWYLSQTRVSGNTTVMLRCDSYDKDIDHITAFTDATLDYYLDGVERKDSSGKVYFYYDIEKITSNITVTVYYKDGTSASSTDGFYVDGMQIVYKHNQNVVHWYPSNDPEYISNELVISVLDKTCSLEIEIDTSNIVRVNGLVTDTLGNPLEGAVVNFINSSAKAVTNADGRFSLLTTKGSTTCTVSHSNAISRDVNIVASANASDNNFESTPIELCCYDYVKDNIINAKDFSLINMNDPDDEIKDDFQNHINFTKQNYPALILSK